MCDHRDSDSEIEDTTATTCSVCGNSKNPYSKYCQECEVYRKSVSDRNAQIARRRVFGDAW